MAERLKRWIESPVVAWVWLGSCGTWMALDVLIGSWWLASVWGLNAVLATNLLLRTYALQRERRGEEERFLGLHMNLIEHWTQFWDALRGEPHNWYTFTPFQLELEHDKMLGGVEFTLILLGLGARVRYNYAMTEAFETIKAGAAEVMRRIEEGDE